MDKLDKLALEIKEKKEKQKQKEVLDNLVYINEKLLSSSEALDSGIKERLDKLIEKEVVKIEEKNIDFPKDFKVNNLGDIKFPEQKDFPEQKEFPSEIGIKKPKWFSLDGIKKEIQELKLTIIKQLSFDPEKYKKKQNAIAVKLVTKDGDSFYNAGGGGSVGGYTGDITVAVDEVEDAGNPKGAGSNGAVTLTLANTSYAIPAVAPTKKFTIILYNGSDTDMYVGFEDSNANGVLIASEEKMAMDLGANQQAYVYCAGAGKILTYTYKLIN